MNIKNYWQILMLLLKVKKEAVKGVKMGNEVKPGWKTTEFWLTVIASVQTLVGSMQGNIPHPYGEIILASLAGIYGVARAVSKKT